VNIIPNPVELISTVDASDLSTAIALANDTKDKVNEIVYQFNLLLSLLGDENV